MIPEAKLPEIQNTVIKGGSRLGRTEQELYSSGGELWGMAPPSPTLVSYLFLFCGDSFQFGYQIGLIQSAKIVDNSTVEKLFFMII